MSKIKCILVGVGGRGMWAVRRTASHPEISAVAMVDRNEAFLSAAAAVNGLPKSAWFSSLEDALNHVECDAVIICTPTVTHAPFSEMAFNRGKHVMVEKAMTHDYEDAENLVAKADRAGVRFCVAQNYSWMRHNVTIRQILDDPTHPHNPGEVAMVDIYSYRFRPEPRTMTYPWAMVWDMTCHHADMLLYWFPGKVEVLEAQSFNPQWSLYPHDSNITASLRIGDSIRCNYLLYHSSTLSETRVIIQGDKGVLEINNQRELLFHSRPEAQLQVATPVLCEMSDSISLDGVNEVLQSFCDQILRGGSSRISGQENLRILAVCNDVIKAATCGEPTFNELATSA